MVQWDQLVPAGGAHGFGDAVGQAQEAHARQHRTGEMVETGGGEALDKRAQQSENIGRDGHGKQTLGLECGSFITKYCPLAVFSISTLNVLKKC